MHTCVTGVGRRVYVPTKVMFLIKNSPSPSRADTGKLEPSAEKYFRDYSTGTRLSNAPSATCIHEDARAYSIKFLVPAFYPAAVADPRRSDLNLCRVVKISKARETLESSSAPKKYYFEHIEFLRLSLL